MLEVRNLRKYFAVHTVWRRQPKTCVRALDDVSFDLFRGETLGLVGESGSGKTTTGRVILRLLEPSGGTVLFRPKSGPQAQSYPIFDLRPAPLRCLRRHMQMIFQDPLGSLNPRLTIAATLEEGLRAHGMLGKVASQDKIARTLAHVGLDPNSAQKYPHAFSGGQRQRIAIARALVLDPVLIVCDEPVSSLDVSVQAQIVNLLCDLQEKHGLAYLFISHDIAVVAHVSQRMAVMYSGQIVEVAACADLCRQPAHPYTRHLLQAATLKGIASTSGDSTAAAMAAGSDQNPARSFERGCQYQRRCPEARPECTEADPPLVQIGTGHVVRCHLYYP
jgi:oligopeptide/dipeptide ABC transporter ATP-binding protein